jgi:hypothetical protein
MNILRRELMNIDEVKQFVSELLKKDGFSQCEFDCIMKTNGTNVWNVVTTSGVKKFEIILTDEKNIISKKSINEFKRFIFEDKINVSDKVEVTSTHEYVKKNPKTASILIGFFIGSIIIGHILGGGNPIPTAISTILGIIPFFIKSEQSIKEIRQHQ